MLRPYTHWDALDLPVAEPQDMYSQAEPRNKKIVAWARVPSHHARTCDITIARLIVGTRQCRVLTASIQMREIELTLAIRHESLNIDRCRYIHHRNSQN